jgi:tripartite-type tricarboxylate transporter receptor subunit TctC
MKLPRRNFLQMAAGAAALPTMPRFVWAQTYPSRPITVVVPFSPAGLIDALARILAEPLRGSLAQSVVIENIGGANGIIGVGRVARALPDGYTLSIGGSDQFVLNGAIYPLQYDVVNDFEPIALLATSPALIVTRTAVPANDLKELMVWLKTNHDRVVQGNNGVGSSQHLCGLELQKAVGTRWPFAPYRGAAPALQDLIGGQIDLMCAAPAAALALVRSGRLRAHAVTAKSRLSSAPDIPTVDEAGLPGLYSSVWVALFAPKGTPEDVIAKLNSAVVRVLADPAVRQRITDLGMESAAREQQSPEALRALQKAEVDKWWPIIKAANIKGE